MRRETKVAILQGFVIAFFLLLHAAALSTIVYRVWNYGLDF